MSQSKLKKYFLWSLLFYKVFFDLAYAFLFVPIFSYDNGFYGTGILMFNNLNFIITSLFCIVIIYVLFNLKNTYYLTILTIIYIFAFIPSMSILFLKNESLSIVIITLIYWAAFFSFGVLFSKKLPKKINEVFSFRAFKYISFLFFIFNTLIIFFTSFYYTNFRLLFSFDVYIFREEFFNLNLPILLNYYLLFCGFVFLPFTFMNFLLNKQFLFAFFNFFVGFVQYSLNGHKSILFVYIIVLSLFIVFSILRNPFKSLIFINSSLVFVFIFSYFLDKYLQFSTPAIFLYRSLPLPQLISNQYLKFFLMGNEPLLLRDSIFRYFFKSPYPTVFSFYITGGDSNANNGLIGDAFANFLYLGLIVYPFLINFVFFKIYYIFSKFNIFFMFSFIFILIWNLLNASFFTWLLSFGVLSFYFLFSILILLKKLGLR